MIGARRVVLLLCVLGGLSLAGDPSILTFRPDDEGFIRDWLLLDPIRLNEKASTHEEAAQKEFFQRQYFAGQEQALPAEGEKVTVDGRELTWHARHANDYAISFEDHATDVANSMFLGVCYLVCQEEMPQVRLAIGSDDSSRWTLNGKEVIRVYEGRGIEKDQNLSDWLTLKKGANVLRMMVINGQGPAGACARFLDRNGAPVRSLRVTLVPPRIDARSQQPGR